MVNGSALMDLSVETRHNHEKVCDESKRLLAPSSGHKAITRGYPLQSCNFNNNKQQATYLSNGCGQTLQFCNITPRRSNRPRLCNSLNFVPVTSASRKMPSIVRFLFLTLLRLHNALLPTNRRLYTFSTTRQLRGYNFSRCAAIISH